MFGENSKGIYYLDGNIFVRGRILEVKFKPRVFYSDVRTI